MSLVARIFGGRRKADALIAQGQAAEKAGDLERACDFYRRSLEGAPHYSKAHLNLGVALQALGDVPGASAAFEAAIAADPRDPYANYNLAHLRYTQGFLAEAQQLLTRALASQPDFREAHVLLGCVRDALGQPQAAVLAFETALRLDAHDFGTQYHYARALRAAGRFADARMALERALALDPGNADALAALADVLVDLGDSTGAMRALEAVLAQRSNWADALCNYALLLKRGRRLQEAEDALRRALAVSPVQSPEAASPTYVRAAQLLGAVLLQQGRTQEALELFAAARRQAPQDFALASAELFAMLGSDAITEEELFARHVAFGDSIQAACPAEPALPARVPDPERRLRIGYLSADFAYHVISLVMLPLLERHDRSVCETYCYSTVQSPDQYTKLLAERSDVWRDCARLTDEQIAEIIARDRIDILVDLAGHSSVPRLGVMARRAAPVQATWIGYLHSTGLSCIDYRITDAVADPPGLTERFHTEALARLPNAQWCWRPFLTLPHQPTPPCAKNTHVTFGSIHGASKLSPTVRKLWAQILSALPRSRLVVLGMAEERQQEALLSDLRVARERVTLVPYVSLKDYLRWFDAIDVVLDPMPYSGAMTTCDALYMGVPVLTAPGVRSASRSAASVLSNVGLGEWIASSPEDYVRRAVACEGNKGALHALRSTLRGRLQASPIMREAQFARDLEQVYRRMWQQWCDGGAPRGWPAAPQGR